MKKRLISLDAMKVILSFFVIYTHSVQYTNQLTNVAQKSFCGLIELNLYNFSQIAVPLFLMISSTLIVVKAKTPSVGEIILKVIESIVCIWGWSLVYYCVIYQNVVSNVSAFFQITAHSLVIGPLWYMYAYIIFLLFTPFLCKYCTKIQFEYVVLFIILYFAAVAIPRTLESACGYDLGSYFDKFFPELSFTYLFMFAGGALYMNKNVFQNVKFRARFPMTSN